MVTLVPIRRAQLGLSFVEEHQSVTIWLRQLAQGDQEAAGKLWERYGPELLELSRRKYRGVNGPQADEEDLVQSVFRSLWQGARRGQLHELQDREQLWWLLLSITRRKACNRHAYNQRSKRARPTVSLSGTSEDSDNGMPKSSLVDADQPPADWLLILAEEQDRLFTLLRDDTLREIAQRKLDGFTHQDIASNLGVTVRTVIRKFQLIREIWSKELDS